MNLKLIARPLSGRLLIEIVVDDSPAGKLFLKPEQWVILRDSLLIVAPQVPNLEVDVSVQGSSANPANQS